MCHKFVRGKKVLHGKLKSISLRRQALLLQNRRSRKVLEVSIRPMMKPKRDSMNNKVLCCHIFFAQPPRRRKSKGRRISAGTSGPKSLNGIWCGSAWVYKLPSVPDIRRVVQSSRSAPLIMVILSITLETISLSFLIAGACECAFVQLQLELFVSLSSL